MSTTTPPPPPPPKQHSIYKSYVPSSCSNKITSAEAFAEWVPTRNETPEQCLQKHIGQKVLRLDKFVSSENEIKKQQRPSRRVRLSKTQLKERGLLRIENDPITYHGGLILNHLWNQYIASIINLTSAVPSTASSTTLALADFHGALISVVQCKNPSMVGLTGIIIQETQQTFKIISPDDRIRTLIKADSIFHMKACDKIFVLFGQHLCRDGPQRSKQKIKPKETLRLN